MAKDTLIMWNILGNLAFFSVKKQATRTPIQNRAFYKAAFTAATKKYNLPAGLIERIAQQECSFRSDIIHGSPNHAGAIGIMQIVPKWHPDASPRDPYAAIDYGAGYLKQLYTQFGNWQHALMAYNWGPGNVKKLLAGTIIIAPKETQNYWRQILKDVNIG